MAPMEGVTGYIFRNIHSEQYQGVDRYYIPFIEPHTKREYNSKEKNEICRRNNRVCAAVPQILTKNAVDFLRTAEVLCREGYQEINLNLGCPSGTVVAKGKGSGFLEDRMGLDEFLAQIYEKAPCAISIKTRIGRYEREEFPKLLEIYNRYPIKELTIHPRTREDYYRNKPDFEMFGYALEHSKNPLVYNGDINTVDDFIRLKERFPQIDRVMIGRGLVADPALAEKIRLAAGEESKAGTDYSKRFWNFHDTIYREYRLTMSGEQPALSKMKELWYYWQAGFENREKQIKKIRKAKKSEEYLAAAAVLR